MGSIIVAVANRSQMSVQYVNLRQKRARLRLRRQARLVAVK
ncbi:MAG: hypothetical protein AB7N80_09160 [Bdellovibrionales bacterium]